MTTNFKVFLIGLGVLFGCFLLMMVSAIAYRAVRHESDVARLKQLEYKLQVLRDTNTRTEADLAGKKAVREYDMKHASQEELGRMNKASMRELERLDAMIRVQKQRQ